jgi:uncharacterized membrane protein (UPF0127 family)
MLRHVLLLCALLLAACSGGLETIRPGELTTRQVVLPDGTKILAESMRQELDMTRGMMFRDSLAEDRGMLFTHGAPGRYPYWMYQVKIPLDIIWMDSRGYVVEILAKVPPCPSKSARECPNYGGTQDAQYVLELAAGMAAKHNLRVGDRILF